MIPTCNTREILSQNNVHGSEANTWNLSTGLNIPAHTHACTHSFTFYVTENFPALLSRERKCRAQHRSSSRWLQISDSSHIFVLYFILFYFLSLEFNVFPSSSLLISESPARWQWSHTQPLDIALSRPYLLPSFFTLKHTFQILGVLWPGIVIRPLAVILKNDCFWFLCNPQFIFQNRKQGNCLDSAFRSARAR